ncbi:MAG: flagellar protein FliS [Pirellulaceae bacterium]
MSQLDTYKKAAIATNWTRAEMLVFVYDRLLASLEACEIGRDAGDEKIVALNQLEVFKAIAALESGLRPDEDEVAANIARLLHFVVGEVENHNFNSSIRAIQPVRDAFAAIQEQANQLEAKGEIQPVPDDVLKSMA